MIDARFGHVNVVARDWGALAAFYERIFGCVPVPPERDYSGPELAAGTGVPHAALRGVHLRLPGHGPDGPTIEIYEYFEELPGLPTAANRPGSDTSRSWCRTSPPPGRSSSMRAAPRSATWSRSR
ncbi:MAG TPA: hypothetical protein VGQ58_04365, partial [Candidatus Limnocylindrales bacterium]|nr:hypothetical protein [Candidatus Limnocylindrales bacterium]